MQLRRELINLGDLVGDLAGDLPQLKFDCDVHGEDPTLYAVRDELVQLFRGWSAGARESCISMKVASGEPTLVLTARSREVIPHEPNAELRRLIRRYRGQSPASVDELAQLHFPLRRRASPASFELDRRAVVLVVIVEDDPDGREIMTELLRFRDFEVIACGDGQEALETITRVRPDAAIVDLGLPDMSGIEVGRRAREINPSLWLVANTGYERERDHALEAGFDRYVLKPVSLEVVEDALEAANDSSRLMK